MSKNNTVYKIVSLNSGVAKTSDFTSVNIKGDEVASYCKNGLLKRIRQGYYVLADAELPPEEILLKTLIPEAVVSGQSALYHYGYTDYTPRKWYITVPRSISRTKLKIDCIKFDSSYVVDKWYDLGLTKANFNGTFLKLYDKERIICDCIRNKFYMNSEFFYKALRSYALDQEKNLYKLFEYAKKMNIAKRNFETLEVLLND